MCGQTVHICHLSHLEPEWNSGIPPWQNSLAPQDGFMTGGNNTASVVTRTESLDQNFHWDWFWNFFNIFFGPISRQGGGREKITLEMEVALCYKLITLLTLQSTSYCAYTAFWSKRTNMPKLTKFKNLGIFCGTIYSIYKFQYLAWLCHKTEWFLLLFVFS